MLGRGGMAVVWRAVDVRLGRPVAVKLLDPAGLADPALLERFDREARTAARLAHPNIVAVHDVGDDAGQPYLVMELVDGESLAAALAGEPLPIEQVVSIAGQVCDALAAAHAAGIVHRDIKPANILLDRRGGVKVCDFGIARVLHAGQAALTAPATTIGTSQYMAPEQANGEPASSRSDLYALGCVLYAMLTGQPPFVGDNPIGVMWRHLNEPPVPVATVRPDVPPGLDRLIRWLLTKNPALRPESADEVRARLAELPGASRPPAPGAAFGPPATGPAGFAPPTTVGPAAFAPPTTGAADPVRGAAAVPPRTRTLPTLDADAEPPVGRGRPVSRRGLVAAVALGVALLAVLAIAVPLASRSGPDGGNRAGSAPSSPAPTTPADPAPTASAATLLSDTGPAARLGTVRAVVAAQVEAGELDAEAAETLDKRLAEVEEKLADGNLRDAVKKVDDVRDALADLRDDGDIGDAGYQAVRTSLDELAGSLAADGADRGNGKGNGKRRGGDDTE